MRSTLSLVITPSQCSTRESVPHQTRPRGGRVVLVTNSERVRAKSAVRTSNEPAAEKAARNLPLGEGASSTKGPLVSSWSCASCSSTTSSVREEVASTTSGRRATGLAVAAVLASCGWCSRHMAVGAEVRCGSARGRTRGWLKESRATRRKACVRATRPSGHTSQRSTPCCSHSLPRPRSLSRSPCRLHSSTRPVSSTVSSSCPEVQPSLSTRGHSHSQALSSSPAALKICMRAPTPVPSPRSMATGPPHGAALLMYMCTSASSRQRMSYTCRLL
mmetsp:Transcript_30918/g.73375  ORF Transcript_30918/g.73375 Transcript_30918/m.73375 type:complete len:275 (+) Transcript_30918:604-1428(+)